MYASAGSVLKCQNNVACHIRRAPRHQNGTILLQQLHWLPICEWIKYKIACMCCNAITGSAPSYLSELLHFSPFHWDFGHLQLPPGLSWVFLPGLHVILNFHFTGATWSPTLSPYTSRDYQHRDHAPQDTAALGSVIFRMEDHHVPKVALYGQLATMTQGYHWRGTMTKKDPHHLWHRPPPVANASSRL